MRTATILLSALILTACFSSFSRQDRTGEGADPGVPWEYEPPGGTCPWGWTCRLVELPAFNGVDVLVVVDDSLSMEEEQATMAEQFPVLIRNLLDPRSDPASGTPLHVPITDMHIGVVSTDMGEWSWSGHDGRLMGGYPACGSTSRTHLEYDEEAPDPASIDCISSEFADRATLGTDGSGFEQSLEAALLALTVHSTPDGPNDGFLRDDTVLVILFLSDEDDCSVGDAAFWDSDPLLGHINLRCYRAPDYLHDVERYADGLSLLRAGSLWPVLLGMIVGVPPGEPACNGFGDAIVGCLYKQLMEQEVDPDNSLSLRPSCETATGRAEPPRRFVQLAQAFGHEAYVHSICQDDYGPALNALSEIINVYADHTCAGVIIDLDDGPSCTCDTDCQVVHVLGHDGPCPAGLSMWDPERDGSPRVIVDEEGRIVTACEVEAAGTVRSHCSVGCRDFRQTFAPAGEGWSYAFSDTGVACPTVSFTEGYSTPEGGYSFVACP